MARVRCACHCVCVCVRRQERGSVGVRGVLTFLDISWSRTLNSCCHLRLLALAQGLARQGLTVGMFGAITEWD